MEECSPSVLLSLVTVSGNHWIRTLMHTYLCVCMCELNERLNFIVFFLYTLIFVVPMFMCNCMKF